MKDDNSKKLKRYRLGGEFGDKYLTRQEARCMVCLLKDATIKTVAKILELSPRTVEAYVNNMKKRLDCRSKSQLVRMIAKSSFACKVQMGEIDL